MMMKTTTTILFTILCVSLFQFTASAQKQEVLLIGTFHFANPNLDAIKTERFDVLAAKPQQELENIAEKIKAFNPDQIFVEWPENKQAGLDSLYQMYKAGTYNQYINTKYQHTKQFASFKEDETFQLAFRAGKKANLKTIYGIDYNIDMPFDTVMNAIQSAKQTQLKNEIDSVIQTNGAATNHKRKTMGLTDLILDLNTEASRNQNAGFYLQSINRAGSRENFAGAYSVSEWYRRNLYMYALVQKITQPADKRIVILLGAGHISLIKQFIALENRFKIVELKDIL
ncbi:DUF5694 domain-containing protein [Pedobacter sp. AJM]|uniref:DUF5694 domain-containing protein n=1 Tax=Pedobacter sp. AJM TaxID=2003629 RepID=UPI000B4B856C|nr:DUF5694 domain-containing protein [Pedobacter sp. AJM]OWK71654.1 hypothetical protein CBW18_04060 [Pedobacter sp. AJM]